MPKLIGVDDQGHLGEQATAAIAQAGFASVGHTHQISGVEDPAGSGTYRMVN
jgi:hypothetical protein